MKPRILTALFASVLVASLSSCAHKKDEEGIPPKYKPRPVRDPVEQRIFYDGWWKI